MENTRIGHSGVRIFIPKAIEHHVEQLVLGVHPSMTVNVCDTANFSVNEDVSRSFLVGDDDVLTRRPVPKHVFSYIHRFQLD